MKVCWHGFAGRNHSWSIVAQNICRQLIKLGHHVDIFSTNGDKHFPNDLRANLIGFANDTGEVQGSSLSGTYDMQLSYTAMRNFPNYFNWGSKNRFGIWCYEFFGPNSLPVGFAKNHHYVDSILAPSNFAKQIFLDSKIPEEKVKVVPHGFDYDKFLNNKNKYPVKTDKKRKILLNVAQPHIRKNLEGTLEAYGRAFTNKDDVCLILKVVDKKPEAPFEVHFTEVFNSFKKKFKNHAEVVVIKDFIDNIEELYNSCDILFSMTRAECFNFPALEAFAAQKVVIVPKWGGHLDFLNDDNSILISGKQVNAPSAALYWQSKPGTTYFEPNLDEAAEKLIHSVKNYEDVQKNLLKNSESVLSNYTWEKVTKDIVDLCV